MPHSYGAVFAVVVRRGASNVDARNDTEPKSTTRMIMQRIGRYWLIRCTPSVGSVGVRPQAIRPAREVAEVGGLRAA